MQSTERYSPRMELMDTDTVTSDVDSHTATSVIGPEGGFVEVEDPQSSIFGTCLRVPPGALDTPVRISIIEGDHACSFGFAPSIKLLPSGLRFKRIATLEVCLNDPCVTELYDLRTAKPALFNYDEKTNQWAHDETVGLDLQGNAVLCNLSHL